MTAGASAPVPRLVSELTMARLLGLRHFRSEIKLPSALFLQENGDKTYSLTMSDAWA